MKGIITLKDLKNDPNIYVDLNNQTKLKLKNKIKKEYKTFSKFSRKFNLPLDKLSRNNNLIHFFEGHKIPLPFLLKITKPFGREFTFNYLSKNLSRMGTRRRYKEIINPNIPFDFRKEEGIRIISAILHDGGISKAKQAYYRNNNELLRNEVTKCFGRVFGEVVAELRDTCVFFPKITALIILKLDGLKEGSKVFTNPSVPNFIFSLSEEYKSIFLQQAFDDDGNVGVNQLSIGFNIASDVHKNTIPNLLLDDKRLLEDLKIRPNKIRLEKEFKTKKEESRRRYLFTISGRENLETFHKKIKFLIRYKEEKISKKISSYKQYHLKKGEPYKKIKATVFKFFKQNEFTIKSLSEKSGFTYHRTKQLIWELEKKDVTVRVDRDKLFGVRFRIR